MRCIVMASNGHFTAHSAQPVQPLASCSWLFFCHPGTACSHSTPGAHTATHQPQPVQRAVSMWGRALGGVGMLSLCARALASAPYHRRQTGNPCMPETTFLIPNLRTQVDADAVMFELQDLPCVGQANVNLPAQTAWVSHTAMIAPDDIAAALADAGYPAQLQGA